MAYFGDIHLGDTLTFKFNTVDTSGNPITLAGTPAIACYPAGSTTEITAGCTLTVDFDSRTGMHHVAVAATSGNSYSAATNYDVVLTTGTVSGVSQAGMVLGSFSIDNRFASILRNQLTESYSADGTAPTVEQALFLVMQFLYERAVTSTTVTVKKLDGSTPAATLTLNDATSPTSITRVT